jgi:hypothetical protein
MLHSNTASVSFFGESIDAEFWKRLTSLSELAPLAHVAFIQCNVEDGAVPSLSWLGDRTTSRPWCRPRGLRSLTIEGTWLGPSFWARLGEMMPPSETLVLVRCGLDGATAERLADHAWFDNTNCIDLSYNIGLPLEKIFRTSASSLRHLSLRGCDVSDETLVTLGRLKTRENEPLGIDGLVELNLRDNPITDNGVRLLSQLPLAAIQSLDLSDCDLTVDSVEALISSPWFDQLSELSLWGLELDAEASQKLAEVGNHLLYLGCDAPEDPDAERIIKNAPNLKRSIVSHGEDDILPSRR